MGYNSFGEWTDDKEMVQKAEDDHGLIPGDKGRLAARAFSIADDVVPFLIRGGLGAAHMGASGLHKAPTDVKNLSALDIKGQPERVKAALGHMKKQFPDLYKQIELKGGNAPFSIGNSVILPQDKATWASVIEDYRKTDVFYAMKESMSKHGLDISGFDNDRMAELLTYHEFGHAHSAGSITPEPTDGLSARQYRATTQEMVADQFAAREFLAKEANAKNQNRAVKTVQDAANKAHDALPSSEEAKAMAGKAGENIKQAGSDLVEVGKDAVNNSKKIIHDEIPRVWNFAREGAGKYLKSSAGQRVLAGAGVGAAALGGYAILHNLFHRGEKDHNPDVEHGEYLESRVPFTSSVVLGAGLGAAGAHVTRNLSVDLIKATYNRHSNRAKQFASTVLSKEVTPGSQQGWEKFASITGALAAAESIMNGMASDIREFGEGFASTTEKLRKKSETLQNRMRGNNP